MTATRFSIGAIRNHLALAFLALSVCAAQAKGPTAVLSLTAGSGKGTFAPNYNGKALNVNQTYHVQAVPAAGCIFSNWVMTLGTNQTVSTNAKLTFEMETNLQLTGNFRDRLPPTVKFTTKNNTATSNTVFLVTGTARDNVGVVSLQCQVGTNAPFAVATVNGYTNWSAVVVLDSATNRVQVQASDAAGNTSAPVAITIKNTATGFAPETLAGTSLALLASSNRSAVLDFDDSTLTKIGRGANVSSGVGAYIYGLMDRNTAVLVDYSSLQPDGNTNADSAFTLSFTNPASGAWSNDDGVSGTFTLSSAPATAPEVLSGLTIQGMDTDTNNFAFTNQYGDGTFTENDSLTNFSGAYTYRRYSPTGGLIISTFTNGSGGMETNFIFASFSDTASNDYESLSMDASNDIGTNIGTFAISGTNPVYVGPALPAGYSGVVTEVKSNGARKSFHITFDAVSYGQFSTDTNFGSEVGTYVFSRTGQKTASFANSALLPPDAGGDVEVNDLFFSNSHTANYTNVNSHGVITLLPANRTVPASLVGRKLTGNGGGKPGGYAFGFGTFNGLSHNSEEAGSYTYAVYGPQMAEVTLSYTDAGDEGNMAYLMLWFASPNGGTYVQNNNAGDISTGAFTMK